jgi:hypothetical protein
MTGTYVSCNDSAKTVRDEEEWSLLELSLHGQSQIIELFPKNIGYLLRIPDLLELLHQFPSIIQYCVHSMTRQLRVVAIDHRAALWEVFSEKVTQPHSTQVPLSAPRPVCVSIYARYCNNAGHLK